MADRFILLQPAGVEELSEHLRHKAWVIYQSITAPPGRFVPKKGVFELCVLGHLRPVKDPFRTAMAARRLPPSSRIQVVHVGGALTDDMKTQADAEASTNPRYRWLGRTPTLAGTPCSRTESGSGTDFADGGRGECGLRGDCVFCPRHFVTDIWLDWSFRGGLSGVLPGGRYTGVDGSAHTP